MTCGPDAPSPSTNRPSLTKSQPAARLGDGRSRRGEDVDDAGADLNRRGLGGEEANLADGVERVRLGYPHEVQAGPLQLLHATHIGVKVAGVADRDGQLHHTDRTPLFVG